MKKSLTILIIFLLLFKVAFSQDYVMHHVKYYQQPIVEMTLNDKKTWVLLDTGAGITVLDSGSENRFGFNTFYKTGSQFIVPGFGSENNQLEQVSKAKLVFGKTHLKQLMYAFDLSNIVESIYQKTGKRITAIVGTKVMKEYRFVIDLGSGTVAMNGKQKRRSVKKATGMLITAN
jgi:hypothetical protein